MEKPFSHISHRKIGRPLKRGLIDGSGPGKGGGNYLLFLPVSHRLSPLLGKDQVFPAGVMPDHLPMKKECSRKYQDRRNHGRRKFFRKDSREERHQPGKDQAMDGINEEKEGSACLSDFTKERLFRQQNAQGAQSQNPRNPAGDGVQGFRR